MATTSDQRVRQAVEAYKDVEDLEMQLDRAKAKRDRLVGELITSRELGIYTTETEDYTPGDRG